MTLNISSGTALKITKDSAKNYNANLQNWVDSNSVGYFGTYLVDFNKSIVTHHVKGGILPWYIDTDQQRPFVLKGDTLIIGDNKTWKRFLVKEGWIAAIPVLRFTIKLLLLYSSLVMLAGSGWGRMIFKCIRTAHSYGLQPHPLLYKY